MGPRDLCATPNAGCDCREPNRVVECGQVQRQSGGQVWCSVGHRTCDGDGKWGECEIEDVRVLPAPEAPQSAQALGSPQACTNNPCDPFCQQVVDSGSDLKLPPGLQSTADGAVTLTIKDSDINDTTCTGVELVPSEQTLTVTTLPGGSPGLRGDYFNQRFGSDPIPSNAAVTGSRLDPTVDFDWGTGSPGVSGVGANTFSVRWTGWIKPAVTGSYQLCTMTDDGARLWLNGQQIIDSWFDQGMVERCANMPYATLNAGQLYEIRMELYENAGGAGARLRWKHAGAPAGEIIPASVLLPPGAENQPTAFTVDPPHATFTARALPQGCFDGAVPAAWAVDRLDRATVDNSGNVALLSPIGGDIKTTAYVGPFSAVGTVHVNVNVVDVAQAPAGAANVFKQTPAGTDPMTVLYPYADTVFPLALRAPTVQWDTGGTAASAVMVTVRYPASGAAQFTWSKIMPESQPPRYTIPQEIWSRFEQTAKGKTAALSVQRVTGGVLRPAVTRSIVFASAPVRGKIYYTQYARNGATNMMVADPGSAAAATSVFASDAGGKDGRKCPVCHSVSANGAMFATSDKSFGQNGGLSRINADGSFTLLSDYSSAAFPYQDGQEDWRGFAWAPLTPDGTLALAANNIWGNTKQQVVGIDEDTRTVSVPTTYLSGGNGSGLLAKYYSNATFNGWDWRRFDARVDYDWGSGTPGGPISGAFSVAWSGQVQAYTTETYTFHVETSGGVRLSVGGNVLINQLTHVNNVGTDTFSGSVDLVKGEKTPILLDFTDTAAQAKVFLRWSSPSLGNQAVLVPQTQLYPNDGYHGLLVTYYSENDFTEPFIVDRLESHIDASWGDESPRPTPDLDDDDWSAVYTGQLQAPADGDLRLCVSADDAVVVTLGGVELLNETAASDECSAGSLPVTAGTKYDLRVAYREYTGNANLNLGWQMSGATTFAREIIPSARLTPPAGWTPPEHGLTVTYYDTGDFNASLGGNQASSRATTRIEPEVDLNWRDYRPEHSAQITDRDTFSSRFTGRLEVPCTGMFEFEVYGDDGGRLWIDDLRISHLWTYGTQQSAIFLEQGLHDIKLDHHDDFGNSALILRWKAECMNVTTFTPIPNERFYPTGDAGTAGFVRSGGDNGNDRSYFVWQTPSAAGQPSIDVTGESAGRWGLGATVMMVPSFAPDASKLVFIDGDSSAESGWRKGLSTFEFDRAERVFKNRKTIVSTWPSGDVLKWPVFESDSRSVIYQATVPADMCCRNDDWTKYGYMGPTNYFEDPGRLFSVDTESASPQPVELARLNQGERALDRNKAYQATMLPQASGGYRWAVFTSTRPYGNTLNLQGQQDYSNTGAYTYISDYNRIQSMLWVSAIDDQTSGATDRSHPAFFLPNQNFSENAGSGFLNERAYWVTEACRPPGTGAANGCEVDEDCCAGSVCRIDTPATLPPTRHCFQPPAAGNCAMNGKACVSNSDCCMGSICDDGVCAKPPTLARYAPANFERIYESSCGSGQKVDWTFFDYKASVPEVGGALEFYVESADDLDDFRQLPVAPAAVNLEGVALVGTQAAPGDLAQWTRITLDQPLASAGVVERKYLKLTVRFVPNQARLAAPVLKDWRQSFSCPPGE